MYTYVSCQSFAGGFDVGMVNAGFKLVTKVEQQGGFGMPNCEANRHILGESWTAQVGDWNAWEAPHADAMVANPPCSGFSVMTDKRWRGVGAKINSCMHITMAYGARVKPQILVMESVRSAYSQGRELMTQLRGELEEQSGLRYDAYHVMQNAHNLGGAAIRPRYFLVLSQVPFGIEWPTVRRPLLRDVIGDLDGLASTWNPQPYRRPATWWSRSARNGDVAIDGHMGLHSPYIIRALDLLEQAEEWPEGWHIGKVAKQHWERTGRLPRSWDHMREKLISTDFHMGYTSMTRWVNDRPGRVITGGALGLVMHPTQPRTITHREAARVMGFPDSWRILPLRHRGTGLAMTWGKGITVQCGTWIGEWIKRALDGDPGSVTGVPDGDREWFIKCPR